MSTRAITPIMMAFLPVRTPLSRSSNIGFSSSDGGSYGGACEGAARSVTGPPHIGQYWNPGGRISLQEVHNVFFGSIPLASDRYAVLFKFFDLYAVSNTRFKLAGCA